MQNPNYLILQFLQADKFYLVVTRSVGLKGLLECNVAGLLPSGITG